MSKKPSWVIGRHAVSAVLATQPERALELWYVNNKRNPHLAEVLDTAQQAGVACRAMEKSAISNKVASDNHQGLALMAQPRIEGNQEQLLKDLQGKLDRRGAPLVLVLDQVQDPHNFGACLRTADAAGVDAVVVAKDHASPLTPVVQKVASGAAETIMIYRVSNLSRALKGLQDLGIWIVGTSDKAEQNLYQTNLVGSLAIVMGAEGRGLRELTAKCCDHLVRLPMAGDVVSSLNVSVATGVCLFEAVRQRELAES